MLRRVVQNRFILPASLIAAVSIGGVFAFASSPGAGASQQATRLVSIPCGGYSAKGQTTAKNSGAPNSSLRICRNGKLVAYGNRAIIYRAPSSSLIPAGEQVYAQYCSTCHGAEARGGVPGVEAPNLRGVSAATLHFWVSTGRMPASDPRSVQQMRKPPKLTVLQTNAVVAYVNSLDPAPPFLPTVNVKDANLSEGASLFSLNCAACHTITGAGDALAKDTFAPTLHQATVQQVAEAIRTGPANMPVFSGNLSDSQVRDIVAYVTRDLQHPDNPGGNGLGGVGPVTEGFIGLLFGVGVLMIVCFWIGDRTRREEAQ